MTLPENAPQQIGKYKIIGEIGRGGMGVVYKAIDPYIQRTLAIKTICIDRGKTEADLKKWKIRFIREARLAGKLSHPNIVTIHDVGEASGLFYIAMEYVEGRSLREVIDSHEKLSFEEIQGLLEQICDAISYAHENKILHCDIKPDNILVDKSGNIAIVDFGIARTTTSDVTSTLALMVTPSYAAPERISGKELGPSSDIFSIAATLYELMTGEKPFPGDNISTVIKKILYDEPPEPTSLSPDLPDEINAIIGKALAKDPEERYQTCNDFYAAIADFNITSRRVRVVGKDRENKTLRAPILQVQPHKNRRNNYLTLSLSLATVIIVVSLGAFFFVKKTRSAETSDHYVESHGIYGNEASVSDNSRAVYSSKIHTADKDTGPDKNDPILKNAIYKIEEHDFSSPIQENPSTSNDYLLLAKGFLEKQDYENAIISLKKSLILATDNYNAHYLLGSIFKIKKQYDKAVIEYEKVISIEESFPLPYKGLGEIFEERKKTGEALSCYQKYCDLSSDETGVSKVKERMRNLTAGLQTMEAKNKAIKKKTRLLAENQKRKAIKQKQEIEKYFKKGVKSLNDRKFSQAITCFRKVLTLEPEHKEGKAHLQLAQDKAKKKIDTLYAQGVSAFKKGDYPGAKSYLSKVLKLEPGHSSAKKQLRETEKEEMIAQYFTDGVKAYNVGDYAQTMDHFREVLKLDSNNEEAKRYIKMAKLESMENKLEQEENDPYEQGDAKLPKGW